MKDEDLMRALAEAARRDPDRERAPRWERLAAGEASDDERRALEAIAQGEGEPDAMSAMAPMTDALERRVMARLAPAGDAHAHAPSTQKKVIPLPRVAAVAGLVALAAGVALVATRALAPPAPLPAYAMAVTGGQREVRGRTPTGDPVVVLGADSILAIVLRPDHDVTFPLDVRAAIVRDGHAAPWAPPITVSPTGVVSVRGPAASLVPGPNGPCDLVVVVGPRGAVPESPEALAGAASSERVAVGRAHVTLVDR